MFDILSRVLYNTTRVIARCIMLLDVKRIVNTPEAESPLSFQRTFLMWTSAACVRPFGLS